MAFNLLSFGNDEYGAFIEFCGIGDGAIGGALLGIYALPDGTVTVDVLYLALFKDLI